MLVRELIKALAKQDPDLEAKLVVLCKNVRNPCTQGIVSIGPSFTPDGNKFIALMSSRAMQTPTIKSAVVPEPMEARMAVIDPLTQAARMERNNTNDKSRDKA